MNSRPSSAAAGTRARRLKRAQILPAADAGVGDEEIARNVGVGGSTIYRTKRRFVLGKLRNRRFFSLAELNDAVRDGLAKINHSSTSYRASPFAASSAGL